MYFTLSVVHVGQNGCWQPSRDTVFTSAARAGTLHVTYFTPQEKNAEQRNTAAQMLSIWRITVAELM
jgi:hypothetical protein